jgi:ELWxxDGT repeat protein
MCYSQVQFVKDLEPLEDNAGFGSIYDFISLNNEVFMPAKGNTGLELWKSNGTAEGTVILKDINPGIQSSIGYFGSITQDIGSSNLTDNNSIVFNNELYFAANDGVHGFELWKTDGSTEGTTMVIDIIPGAYYDNTTIGDFTIFNNKLYFYAKGYNTLTNQGTEAIYVIDGINEGASKIKGFYEGQNGGIELIVFNNSMYFSYGWYLWKSDGTTNGTVQITNGDQNAELGPAGLFVAGNTMYFRGYSGSTLRRELWKSDGTKEGTTVVKIINPNGSSTIDRFISFNNEVYFNANDGVNGYELWKTNGTENGTVMLKDINPGTLRGVYGIEDAVVYNNELYFSAVSPEGHKLWKTDGTDQGTRIAVNHDVSELVVYNNEIFFKGYSNDYGYFFGSTNGTDTGTTIIDDGLSPYNFTIVNDKLFFASYTATYGSALYYYGNASNPPDPEKTIREKYAETHTVREGKKYKYTNGGADSVLYSIHFTAFNDEGRIVYEADFSTFVEVDGAVFETWTAEEKEKYLEALKDANDPEHSREIVYDINGEIIEEHIYLKKTAYTHYKYTVSTAAKITEKETAYFLGNIWEPSTKEVYYDLVNRSNVIGSIDQIGFGQGVGASLEDIELKYSQKIDTYIQWENNPNESYGWVDGTWYSTQNNNELTYSYEYNSNGDISREYTCVFSNTCSFSEATSYVDYIYENGVLVQADAYDRAVNQSGEYGYRQKTEYFYGIDRDSIIVSNNNNDYTSMKVSYLDAYDFPSEKNYYYSNGEWVLSNISSFKEYDIRGNVTQINKDFTTINLSYDLENRIIKIEKPNHDFITIEYTGDYITNFEHEQVNESDGTLNLLTQEKIEYLTTGNEKTVISFMYLKDFGGTDTNFVYKTYYEETPPLAIKENEFFEFSLYPNPTNNEVYIFSENLQISSANVYNLIGEKITSKEFSSNSELNLTLGQQSGLYIVELISVSGQSKIIKVVKQ